MSSAEESEVIGALAKAQMLIGAVVGARELIQAIRSLTRNGSSVVHPMTLPGPLGQGWRMYSYRETSWIVTAPSSHDGRRIYYSLRALKNEMRRVYNYVDDGSELDTAGKWRTDALNPLSDTV